MKPRSLIMVGLALAVAASLAATTLAANDEPPRAQLSRHRESVQRPPVERERARSTPTPSPDVQRQSGSSEGQGVHIESETEHHNIHGSGAIAVTSGAVDPGNGGGERQGSRPRKPRARRR